ncbi:HIRAN domain-containing protein [Bacillus thuringiensis]|uniref:HIRAN domain-containing protein n=1 Tax=Bacillus thuringiensis TaxID=1428 RepID=UPI0021D65BC0|nr:HIRAN domain-containing protein [Bacillus thuringiensis]MCU7667386.1 HIRAN domain-containing protein [Bacillus thuringiensis]
MIMDLKKPNYIRYKNFNLVGSNVNGRDEYIKQMNMLTPVFLHREPKNPHSPNAIGVYVKLTEDTAWAQVGYIPRDIASKIAYYMDKGFDIHYVMVKDIRRETLYNHKLNTYKNFFTFNMDVCIRTRKTEDLELERERYLKDIDYMENRFYFESVFQEELDNRLLHLYRKNGKELSNFRQFQVEKESKKVLRQMEFNDFAGNVGIVKDFIELIDLEIAYDDEDKKEVSLVYKGYPFECGLINRDFALIYELSREEVEKLQEYDAYQNMFFKEK